MLLILMPLLMASGNSYPTNPEQVVANYLQALKNADFPDAHRYLSDDMTRGLDVFIWSVEQKQIFKRAGVELHGYKVYEAVIEGDMAKVPNILSSRDNIFNKKGSDEYELYTLKLNNGYWYIVRQKLVNEKNEDKWFKKVVFSSEIDPNSK